MKWWSCVCKLVMLLMTMMMVMMVVVLIMEILNCIFGTLSSIPSKSISSGERFYCNCDLRGIPKIMVSTSSRCRKVKKLPIGWSNGTWFKCCVEAAGICCLGSTLEQQVQHNSQKNRSASSSTCLCVLFQDQNDVSQNQTNANLDHTRSKCSESC